MNSELSQLAVVTRLPTRCLSLIAVDLKLLRYVLIAFKSKEWTLGFFPYNTVDLKFLNIAKESVSSIVPMLSVS